MENEADDIMVEEIVRHPEKLGNFVKVSKRKRG